MAVNEITAFTKKITRAATSDASLRKALSTTLSIHKPRIFERGLDASGAQIGTYSAKPTYVSESQQARKTGKTKFEGGYAEYKRLVGRNPGFVILRNTDQMYADYGIVFTGKYGFGFQNQDNFNKSQFMEEKYGKDIFDLSSKELDILADTLVDQLVKNL